MVLSSLILLNSYVIYFEQNYSIRESIVSALNAVIIVFTVISAVTLSLYNNMINGVRDQYFERVRDIRKSCNRLMEKYLYSDDDHINTVLHNNLEPLVTMRIEDWGRFEELPDLGDWNFDKSEDFSLEFTHFAVVELHSIENDLNELAILYIKSGITMVYSKLVSGAFSLIIAGILSVVLGYILPDSQVMNIFATNFAFSIIVFGLLEIIYLKYFLTWASGNEVVGHD